MISDGNNLIQSEPNLQNIPKNFRNFFLYVLKARTE